MLDPNSIQQGYKELTHVDDEPLFGDVEKSQMTYTERFETDNAYELNEDAARLLTLGSAIGTLRNNAIEQSKARVEVDSYGGGQ